MLKLLVFEVKRNRKKETTGTGTQQTHSFESVGFEE